MELTNVLVQLFIFALCFVALTAALTEVIKKAARLKKRFVPLISVGVGIVISLAFTPVTDVGWYYMLLVGFVAGLTASGAFDITKAIKDIVTVKRDDLNG